MIMTVRRWAAGLAVVLAVSTAACSNVGGLDASPGALMSGGRDIEKEQEALERFQPVQTCPTVQVRQGTQVVRKYAQGKEEDPAGVTYQGTLSRFARECRQAPDGGTSIRVGVYGRIIAGAASGDGGVSTKLPLRVVLVKNGSEVLFSELVQVDAVVPPGEGSAGWTRVVEGLSVPYHTDDSTYVIYVGFDEAGA
jgi:hypothetical protein